MGYDGTDLMKVVYNEERIETTLAKRTAIWDRVKKYTESKPQGGGAGGQYFEFYAETVRSTSSGWIDPNGSTRTASNPDGVLGRVYAKYRHHPLEINEATMSQADTNWQAYENGLKRLRDSMMDDNNRKRCLSVYGNRFGVIAFTSGNGSYGTVGTPLPVNGQYGFTDGAGNKVIWGAESFEQGDQILIYDLAGGTGSVQARTVVNRTPANPVLGTAGSLVLNSAVTLVTGHTYIIVFGEQDGSSTSSTAKSDYSASGRAAQGFADLFCTADTAPLTAKYENITHADSTDDQYAPRWKPSVYTGGTAGTAESMDSSHLTKVVMGPSTESGRKINVLVMNDALFQSFMNYFEQQVIFPPTDFEGGMRKATWQLPDHKVELYFDALAPHGCIIGLSEDKMRRFEVRKPGWMNRGGNEFYLVDDKLAWKMIWVEGWTFGTFARAAHSIHKDIREEVQLFT
ncbi:MAG: hypothetical protein WC789_10635 [Lentisphaeria bacterium]